MTTYEYAFASRGCTFKRELFVEKMSGSRGWFIHGRETTGDWYGGNFIKCVGWRRETKLGRKLGWTTKREALEMLPTLEALAAR